MSVARTNSPVLSHTRTLVLVILAITGPRYNPAAYNINPHNAQVFSDPVPASPHRRGSYFGYSVALYAAADGPLLLVGAPRANYTTPSNVNEPGTVFKCTMNGVCKEWVVDGSANGLFPKDRRINQVKNNAWIGANIVVENKTAARVVVRCSSLSSSPSEFLGLKFHSNSRAIFHSYAEKILSSCN